MFSKIEVNGDGACELYQLLTSAISNPEGKPDIAWNFTKFLIDGDGNVVERFEPGTVPEEIGIKLQDYLS
jgi:glutathione peroxidase